MVIKFRYNAIYSNIEMEIYVDLENLEKMNNLLFYGGII